MNRSVKVSGVVKRRKDISAEMSVSKMVKRQFRGQVWMPRYVTVPLSSGRIQSWTLGHREFWAATKHAARTAWLSNKDLGSKNYFQMLDLFKELRALCCDLEVGRKQWVVPIFGAFAGMSSNLLELQQITLAAHQQTMDFINACEWPNWPK